MELGEAGRAKEHPVFAEAWVDLAEFGLEGLGLVLLEMGALTMKQLIYGRKEDPDPDCPPAWPLSCPWKPSIPVPGETLTMELNTGLWHMRKPGEETRADRTLPDPKRAVCVGFCSSRRGLTPARACCWLFSQGQRHPMLAFLTLDAL